MEYLPPPSDLTLLETSLPGSRIHGARRSLMGTAHTRVAHMIQICRPATVRAEHPEAGRWRWTSITRAGGRGLLGWARRRGLTKYGFHGIVKKVQGRAGELQDLSALTASPRFLQPRTKGSLSGTLSIGRTIQIARYCGNHILPNDELN